MDYANDALAFGLVWLQVPPESPRNCTLCLLLLFRMLFAYCFLEFFFVLRLDKGFQVIQAGRPECPILLKPGINRLQRLGIELIQAMPPFPSLLHQVCTA